MATPGKSGKKEAKRHIPVKASLNTPFNLQWTPIRQRDLHHIQNTLRSKLARVGLKKMEAKRPRKWKRKKPEEPPKECVSAAVIPETQEQGPPKHGWTDAGARRQLAVGINEVTKALERNELRLALVCKSVRPQHMTDHLMALSSTRQVPACQVAQLSSLVSEPLGLKSVLALGFRTCPTTDGDVFSEIVDAITPRVPPLSIPWLQAIQPRVTPMELLDVENEASDRKGQKRKLDEVTSEITQSDATESVSCTLQPLKVKKVIPNPLKNRARKKKNLKGSVKCLKKSKS